MKFLQKFSKNPWSWVPSLYYAEGIPYVVVMSVSVIMYKRLGISNTEIALYTSWLYLPWVIKSLWSPLVDTIKTKRFWIVTMQLLIGAGLAGVAFTIPLPSFFQYTLAFLWLLAFSSATHDVAADGFYMLGLSQGDQAFFVGIRSTFYRLATITGQGLLIILAGYVESHTGLDPVELKVSSSNQIQIVQFVNPDSVSFGTSADLKILVSNQEATVPMGKADKAVVDSLVSEARKWNTTHGFYIEEKAAVKAAGEPGWWDKSVAMPLESFLKNNFGAENKPVVKTATSGNLAFFYLKLSGKPDENVVVNLDKSSGDNSFKIIEGGRITFTPETWNRVAVVAVQVDPKLDNVAAASFEGLSGNIKFAWVLTFFILSGLFVVFSVYHKFALPFPAEDANKNVSKLSDVMKEFFGTFGAFFKKKNILLILGFLLLYRFAEAQLVKLVAPFLMDSREVGGLGLSTGEVGFVYGTIGILALTLGGITGGIVASRGGLKKWLIPMVFSIHLPNSAFVYLSHIQPESFFMINLAVAVEQFGYGFGFTAYMLYMIYVSDGEHKTAHFAICTSLMALGMMVPGMFSGWLQEIIGYKHFFIWVMISTIPGFIIAFMIKVDPKFGIKEKAKK